MPPISFFPHNPFLVPISILSLPVHSWSIVKMADFAPPSGPPPPRVPEGWKAQWNAQYSEWYAADLPHPLASQVAAIINSHRGSTSTSTPSNPNGRNPQSPPSHPANRALQPDHHPPTRPVNAPTQRAPLPEILVGIRVRNSAPIIHTRTAIRAAVIKTLMKMLVTPPSCRPKRMPGDRAIRITRVGT